MLRFPLAVFVVFIHSLGPNIDVEQLHANALSGMAFYDYIRIFISVVIARSAVPLFFIFSGFLLFKGMERYDRNVYVGKLRKRWHTLAKPYFLWNIQFVLWSLRFIVGGILLHGKPWSGVGDYFMESGYLHMLWDSGVWDERTTWLGNDVYKSSPILFPFWYVRDLMVLVIISPVVHWLVKRLRISFILLLLAVYLLDIRPSWCSSTIVTGSLFFSVGAYFAIMKQDFTQVLWRWRQVICPLAVALIIVQTATGADKGDYASRMVHLWLVVVQTLAFIIAAHALCRFNHFNRLKELNKSLAETSFFIFAFHVFILGHVRNVITKITPMNDTWYMQTIDYLLIPIVCVGICIAMYAAGRRWLPGVTKLMMGERK